jgi:hypothetical protein
LLRSVASHAGGVDTPIVSVTYHDRAALEQGAESVLFGLTAAQRAAAFDAGRAAPMPRWVGKVLRFARLARAVEDDFGLDTARALRSAALTGRVAASSRQATARRPLSARLRAPAPRAPRGLPGR